MVRQLLHIGSSPVVDIAVGYAPLLALMAFGYGVHLLPDAWKVAYRKRFSEAGLGWHVAAAAVAIGLAWQAMQAGTQPFIYFQF